MGSSKQHTDNLGLNKTGKNIRKSSFQQTISFGNDNISSSRYLYPNSVFYEVRQEEFKSFIQNVTGNQSNQLKSQARVARLQKNRPPPLSIVRPPIPVQVSEPAPPPIGAYNSLSEHPLQPITGPPFVYNLEKSQNKVTRLQKNRPPPLSIVRPPIPVQVLEPVPPPIGAYNSLSEHPLQPITGHPFVYNLENNLVESPISAFMRKFQDSMMSYDNSRGNQFQPDPYQPQVFNNLDVQYQPIIPYQEHHYPMNDSNQLVNNFHTSQTNGNNQLVNGFPSTQENVSNPSMSLIATNPNFLVNNSNQLVNGFPSSKTNGPRSPTSEFLLSSPSSNMNSLPPSPSSPDPHLQNWILSPDPPSLLSSGIFTSFTSPKRTGFQ